MFLSRDWRMSPLFLATLFAQSMPYAPEAQSSSELTGCESPVRFQVQAACAVCA